MEKLKKFYHKWCGYIIFFGLNSLFILLLIWSWTNKYQSLKENGKYTVASITSNGTNASYEWYVHGERYSSNNYWDRALIEGEKYLLLYDPNRPYKASLLIHRPILSAKDTLGLDSMKVKESDLNWRLM